MKCIVFALVVLSACTDDTDPAWQLDHDRIIAIRATPPTIAATEHAVIDGLRGFHGAALAEAPPDAVTVLSPAGLTGAVTSDGARWIATAPGDDQLAAVRVELGLAADAPVPLAIEARYGELRATKTIWLGAHADNPAMADIEIDRAAAPSEPTELVVPALTDVPLSIGITDDNFDINWLTSCGTMHDFDLASAYLHVEADDAMMGQLALVVRDGRGGVSWRIWPIRAAPP